ncbi:hypothetical protein DFJ73DRAFT_149830 [Zopfochytrium polystomum]|nr:hypothetical protein DFJ73DRAFT_149830 [Zopfochytrium polystomum]
MAMFYTDGSTRFRHLFQDIAQLKIIVQCEKPNESLVSFQGRISVVPDHVDDATHAAEAQFASLSMSNMLLRGAVLRNKDFVWGVVVYTGHNTKIINNLKTTGLKSSRMEKWLNWLVAGAFVFNAFLLLGSTLQEWFHYKDVQEKETARLAAGITDYVVEWYLGPSDTSLGKNFADYFVSCFSLYTWFS